MSENMFESNYPANFFNNTKNEMYDMGYYDALNGDERDPLYDEDPNYMKGYDDGEYWSQ